MVSAEYLIQYAISLGVVSFFGILFVDFFDRKLPRMLGVS